MLFDRQGDKGENEQGLERLQPFAVCPVAERWRRAMANTNATRATMLAKVEHGLRRLADRLDDWFKRLPLPKGVDESRFISVEAGGRKDRAIVEAGGLFAEAFSLGACADIVSKPAVQKALSEADRDWTSGRAETGKPNSDWRDTQVFNAVRGVLVKARTLTRSDTVADAIRAFADLMADAGRKPTAKAKANDELREPQDCEKAAYYAFRYAEMKLQRTLKTQEAHEFWTEHGFDSADRDTNNADVLRGYEIPSLATYRSQLSRARKVFDDQRSEDRTGRRGRSVVNRDDLD